MDKCEEREQLQRVFGAHAINAREYERPDFLFEVGAHRTLGVEVSSFYASNADAKLKRIPEYSDALLDLTRRVHRADRDALQVGDIALLKADGSVVDTVTAIVQEMPSPKACYDMLAAKIKEKEGKAKEYLRNCDEVDLVLLDASNLFYHDTHEDFYELFHALTPKQKLIASPFREIHVITTTSQQKQIYIPLIANVFVADCFAFEYLLQSEIEAGRPKSELFQILSACLWNEGYSRLKIFSEGEGIGFFCGAWEVFYADDRKALRDWSYPYSQYLGQSISTAIADIPADLLEIANGCSKRRNSLFSAMDVRLPVHELKGGR